MLQVDSELNAIERFRDEIVWRIVSLGVLPEQRTLSVDVVAEAFLDRMMDALERKSYLDLLTWIDSTCEFHANTPQVGSMLASAARAVANTLGAHGASTDRIVDELISVEQSIGGIAYKPRRRYLRREGSAIDEAARLIHALLEQLEARDPLTYEHSHAVSLWCARIARRLSLSESEVEHVARCGLLHDIGKVKVPMEILGAARSLTNEEWGVVKTHPALGEEIVGASKPLRQYASTIRSHHERLDGKGYPDRLAGSQISLATRIVTVADSFNAMIGRRPYRLPMSPGNAIDQLREHRGTQFDPIVVEAMIDVVVHAD